MWRDDPKSSQVKTLWYRPEGKIRTYLRGRIDPRAGNVPVIEDEQEIVRRLQNTGTGPATGVPSSIAVPVGLAVDMFGWKETEFADYD